MHVTNMHPYIHADKILINLGGEMAKWLLFQRTWVQVLAPKSQLKTVTPVSEGLTPSSGLQGY